MSDAINIKLIGWEENKFRKDNKKNSWFRFNHDYFENSKFFNFTPIDLTIYIYILCQCSKTNCDQIVLNFDHFYRNTGLKKEVIVPVLEKFYKNNILKKTRSCKIPNVTFKCPTLHNNTLHNKTNNIVESRSNDFDFEKIYENYPRKEGKTKGILQCVNQIKTSEHYTSLNAAVQNYAEQCRKNNTEKKFIKLFSTFMSQGSWRDYVEVTQTKPTQVITKCIICNGSGINTENFEATGEVSQCECMRKKKLERSNEGISALIEESLNGIL